MLNNEEDLPLYFIKALARLQKAIETDTLDELHTTNEYLQPIVDAIQKRLKQQSLNSILK